MILRGLMLSLPPFLIMLALAVWGWVATPEGAQVPVHFAADGSVNRYGSRLEAFGVMPLMALGLCALFALLPVLDPRGGNLRRSRPVVLVSWAGAVWLLALVQGVITLTVTGILADASWIPRLVGVAVGVLFVGIGNVLGKARPNWFVGIRTPWTLSSDRSWDVAHRWGGRLFVLAGLVSIGAMLVLPLTAGFIVLLAATLGAALVPAVLSYFVWRGDPDRETYNAPRSGGDDPQ
ncbi:MAG: SdpI family protein [Glycocaulis sp.]